MKHDRLARNAPRAGEASHGAGAALLWLRSGAFNLCFYLVLFVYMLACPFLFVLPRRRGFAFVRHWARASSRMLRAIAGLGDEIRGLENLPLGPALIAAKHQSMWETFALIPYLDDPAYILKRELTWIPLFGWYAARFGMIAVRRGARSGAFGGLLAQARERVGESRHILIFPEGTRRPPGAPPAYKYGVTRLYGELGLPCVPVALNSGLFWPRRTFLRHPGTIVAEFLEPIEPGLEPEAFADLLEARIEQASARLAAESAPATPKP